MENKKKYAIFSVFAEGDIELTLEGSGLTYEKVLKIVSEQYIDWICQREDKGPKLLSDNKLKNYIREFEEQEFEYSLGPVIYEVKPSGKLEEAKLKKKDLLRCIKNLLSSI